MGRPKKEFNSAEYHATLVRMLAGQDAAAENPQPGFDPQLYRDVRAEAVRGRRIEDYRPALEAEGFEFFPARALSTWADGQPKTEPEWRSRRLRMAFTETDILTMFRGPEDFCQWCERQQMERRMRASGLVLR